jgi:hypothetical protein
MLTNLLHHLAPEPQQKVEELDEQIYALQGKCETQEDTEKLAELYAERLKLLKGGG